MENILGEDWYGRYCPLCEEFSKNGHCISCPMFQEGEGCLKENSIWERVNCSSCWEEWIINAKLMLFVLKKLNKKYKEIK